MAPPAPARTESRPTVRAPTDADVEDFERRIREHGEWIARLDNVTRVAGLVPRSTADAPKT